MRILLILSILFTGCYNDEKLDGIWFFELALQDQKIPFYLEFKEDNKVILQNNKELINLTYSKSKTDKKIIIPIQNYDVAFELKLTGNTLRGYWIKYNKSPEYKVSIFGMKTNRSAFPKTEKAINLPNKWKISFSDNKNGILNFTNINNYPYASILTETGDYRFLTPKINKNNLILYGFDGYFAFFLTGILKDTNTFTGTMYAGKSFSQKFSAIADNQFKLRDADKITTYKGSLNNIKLKQLGDEVSTTLVTPGKVNIIQIFGTWCPNCIDETKFIQSWRRSNSTEVKFKMVSFERSPNNKHAVKQLKKAKVMYGIDYPIFIGGYTKSDKVSNVFPGLENFISFPTAIYIDKKGKIRKIHAGFSGPATGKYFDEFKKEFNSFVRKLEAE